MKEIITDEFIRYKAGFINGKNSIIEMFIIGNEITFEDNEINEDTWYGYGYSDACNYYSEQIKNNVSLEDFNTKEDLNDCFYKRVSIVNSKENKEIPIAKFRI